jgi:Protein of unknown function (DUF3141)
VFEYEMVIDGRQLERPVNYVLVRIKPEADEASDPKKRPFVIVDPRAGHGPGIGGSRKWQRCGDSRTRRSPRWVLSRTTTDEPRSRTCLFLITLACTAIG